VISLFKLERKGTGTNGATTQPPSPSPSHRRLVGLGCLVSAFAINRVTDHKPRAETRPEIPGTMVLLATDRSNLLRSDAVSYRNTTRGTIPTYKYAQLAGKRYYPTVLRNTYRFHSIRNSPLSKKSPASHLNKYQNSRHTSSWTKNSKTNNVLHNTWQCSMMSP
jgi:hypothetical protein